MFFSNLESIKARMEPYMPDLTLSTHESSRSEINMTLNDEEKAQLRTRIKIEGKTNNDFHRKEEKQFTMNKLMRYPKD